LCPAATPFLFDPAADQQQGGAVILNPFKMVELSSQLAAPAVDFMRSRSAAEARYIVEAALNSLEVEGLSIENTEAPGGLSKPQLKELLASATLILMEGAKEAATAQEIQDVFGEDASAAEGVKEFTSLYTKAVPLLRSQILMKSGFSLDHVTGVTWREDFERKGRHLHKNAGPRYYISLHRENSGKKLEPLSFACTADELADLVARLKDAVKQVERLS